MKARLLRTSSIDGVTYSSNTVLDASPGLIEGLRKSGAADPHPDAVAFALGEGAELVRLAGADDAPAAAVEQATDRPQRRKKGE